MTRAGDRPAGEAQVDSNEGQDGDDELGEASWDSDARDARPTSSSPTEETSDRVDGQASSRVITAILAMASSVPATELDRLVRLLRADVEPLETPRQLRERELRLIATLLEETRALEREPIWIDRTIYDEVRGAEDPTSQALVLKFGSWARVCQAAASLSLNGERRPGAPSLPWATFPRGRPMPAPYEKWEVIEAIRACARALDAWPSSAQYEQWVMERRRRALRAGEWPIRLPRDRVVFRLFGGWEAALGAAVLDDADGAHHRPTPATHQRGI